MIEQKTLHEEAVWAHTRKLQPKVNDWMRRRRIMLYGRAPLELRKVPGDCQQEWLSILQSPVENIVRDANRQIRSSKIHHQLMHAKGLLLIVNEGNLLYQTSADYLAMVARVLQKRTNGERRFSAINAVVYLSIHAVPGGMQPVWQTGLVDMADKELGDFIDTLQQQWFAFVCRGRIVLGRQSFSERQQPASTR